MRNKQKGGNTMNNTKIITIKLNRDVWEKLHSLAKEQGMLFSRYMQKLVLEKLNENLKK